MRPHQLNCWRKSIIFGILQWQVNVSVYISIIHWQIWTEFSESFVGRDERSILLPVFQKMKEKVSVEFLDLRASCWCLCRPLLFFATLALQELSHVHSVSKTRLMASSRVGAWVVSSVWWSGELGTWMRLGMFNAHFVPRTSSGSRVSRMWEGAREGGKKIHKRRGSCQNSIFVEICGSLALFRMLKFHRVASRWEQIWIMPIRMNSKSSHQTGIGFIIKNETI